MLLMTDIETRPETSAGRNRSGRHNPRTLGGELLVRVAGASSEADGIVEAPVDALAEESLTEDTSPLSFFEQDD